ncbi:MAG: hypothetical protein FWE67_14410, partial [Planctomycetaceae bacterium]|nr:hypothetical protein [Planctomycetaceae bacterium]
ARLHHSLQASDVQSPQQDPFREVIAGLSDAAAAFLSQKFHQATKRDIALAVALPDWRKRIENRCFLIAGLPIETPAGLSFNVCGTAAAVISTGSSSSKNLKYISSLTSLARFLEKRVHTHFPFIVPFSAETIQRNLPLVI